MLVDSVMAIVHMLLVISGDVEENPGPLGQHTKDNLDMQSCEEHLYKIATFSFDWKTVGKRLIGSQIIDDISREEQNEQNKRDKMLEKWLEMKGSKATYRVLFDVLQDVQNTQVAEEVQKLASSIATEDKSSPPQAVEQQHPISSTVKHHVMDNCGCGKCDLKGLITNGCPNPLYQQFLYLDTGTLTKNEKDILLLKVKADADAISKEHRHMIHKFKTWMKENVSVEDYRDILFNIPGTIRKEVPMLQDRRKEIKVADHLECSLILSDYYTWFNCSVLKIVLEDAKNSTLKDPTDILSVLQSYTEEVHKYCKRNIFECPPPSCMSPTKGTTYFSLKVEKYQVLDQKTFTAEEIQLFEATLMTSLNIEQYALKLCTVAEGCVELVYSVPLCIYSVLFPLNEEQWKLLTTLGVTELMTKDYHYKRTSGLDEEVLLSTADQTTADGRSPLWTASSNGHLDVVKQLIEAGANVNQADEDGQSPLLQASFKGHLDVVKKLIEAGANVNQARKDNTTPLYVASQEGHHDVVQSLLGAEADVNAAESDKNTTPLYVASQEGHHDVVQSLLRAGANVNRIESDDGQSPLLAASFNGHLNIVEELIEAGAIVNQTDKINTTPLHVASQNGLYEVVQTLLGAGADVNAANSDNNATPLHVASAEGYTEVVQILLEAGANVNIMATSRYKTPLYLASQNGHAAIVQMLVTAGADVNIHDVNNITPLDVALQNGHQDVVQTLLEMGNTSEHYFPPAPIIPRIYAAPTVTNRQPHDMIQTLLQDMNVGDTVHVHRPPTLEEQWPEAKEFVHETVQKMSGMSERTK